jgi:hypothetical protein
MKIITLFFLLIPAFSYSQDRIILNNNNTINGKVLSVTEKDVVLQSFNNVAQFIPRTQITKIIYSDGSSVTLNENTSEYDFGTIEKEKLKEFINSTNANTKEKALYYYIKRGFSLSAINNNIDDFILAFPNSIYRKEMEKIKSNHSYIIDWIYGNHIPFQAIGGNSNGKKDIEIKDIFDNKHKLTFEIRTFYLGKEKVKRNELNPYFKIPEHTFNIEALLFLDGQEILLLKEENIPIYSDAPYEYKLSKKEIVIGDFYFVLDITYYVGEKLYYFYSSSLINADYLQYKW